MKILTQKLTLALALASVAAGHAQTPAHAPAGLLGERFTAFNFGLEDRLHNSDHGYNFKASGNTPLLPGQLDAGGSYAYSWTGGSYNSHAHTLGAYTTAYAPMRGVKPFASAGIGWRWTSAPLGGTENRALWDLAAGVEIPAGSITLTPRVTYQDDFQRSRKTRQAWHYAVEASYWMNPTSAVYGSIGKSDVRNSSRDSWVYEIGLRSRL